MYVGWTTIAKRAEAEALAAKLARAGVAVCVQVDGPIVSYYRWKGEVERAEEFRLTVKFNDDRFAEVEAALLRYHPYEVPEWVVVHAAHVGEKYLSWAKPTPSNLPFPNSQPSF